MTNLEKLREAIPWADLGLPSGVLPPALPLEERDLETLQSAKAFLSSGQPREALSALKELFGQGKLDIRAIALLLQAVGRARPVLGVAAALDQLAQLLLKQWDALEPAAEEKKRKLALSAFGSAVDELRVAFVTACQSSQAEAALESCPGAREVGFWDGLCERVQAAAREHGLESVAIKAAELRLACQAIIRKPDPASPEPSDGNDDTPEPMPVSMSLPEPKTRSSGRAPARNGTKVTLRASTHFFELLDKLRAFDTLLVRNECGKAAIVAQDIQSTIAAFDPRMFFPELFAGFFEGLATRAEELAAFGAELQAPQFAALAQLYKVDLDAFLRAGSKARVGGRSGG